MSTHGIASPLNTVRKQAHSTTLLRDPHCLVDNPNPVQHRITQNTLADDPRIPLRNTRNLIRLPTHGVKPAGALLLRVQRHGLRTGWISLVGAHVDVQGPVADAEWDAAGFDDASVGADFLGLIYEGDVAMAGDVSARVTDCAIVRLISEGRQFPFLLTQDVFELGRLALPLLEVAAKDDLLSVLSVVVGWRRDDDCSKHTSQRDSEVNHLGYCIKVYEKGVLKR